MDKQIHIHLHLGDTVLSLADLFGEVRTALGASAKVAPPPPAAEEAAAPNIREFFVTVYDSSRQAFALGHKLYGSESGAERNSNNGSYSCTASFKLDLTNRCVIGAPYGTDRRYWAVLNDESGYSLGRDSFTSEAALRSRYPSLFAVLVGSEDSDGDVVLSGV